MDSRRSRAPFHTTLASGFSASPSGSKLNKPVKKEARASLSPLPHCGGWSAVNRVPLRKILASNFPPEPIVIGLYGLKLRDKLAFSTTSLRTLSDSSVTDNLIRDVLPTGSWKLVSILCDLEFCRCPVLCLSKRPILTSRFHGCCKAGTVPAIFSWPTRPIFTRGHCDIGFCSGTAFSIPRGRASSQDTATSDSVVALCHLIP